MNFLVVNSDPIVLLDMVGIIRNTWPSAAIESAMNIADAKKAVERLSDVAWAFVEMPVEEFEKTGLSDVISQKHGRIVMGHFLEEAVEHEIISRGWVPLRTPFTDESVREAINGAANASR